MGSGRTATGVIPDQVAGHTAIVVPHAPNLMLVYGGWSLNHASAQVSVLDVITMKWRRMSVGGGSPPARASHVSVVQAVSDTSARMIMFGGAATGFLLSADQFLNDLWALDIDARY